MAYVIKRRSDPRRCARQQFQKHRWMRWKRNWVQDRAWIRPVGGTSAVLLGSLYSGESFFHGGPAGSDHPTAYLVPRVVVRTRHLATSARYRTPAQSIAFRWRHLRWNCIASPTRG